MCVRREIRVSSYAPASGSMAAKKEIRDGQWRDPTGPNLDIGGRLPLDLTTF
jgi:hypothetical protein